MDFDGLVYIIPAASNYIGGDIISGLLVLDIHKKDETSLFFDIGTNGELVIGNRDWMMAGAGAPPKDEVYLTFDRPFLFVISSHDDLPLFAGIVNTP